MIRTNWIRKLRRTKQAATFRRWRARFYLRLYRLRQWNFRTGIAWLLVWVLGVLMYAHVQNLYRIQSIRAAALSVRLALTDIETEQRGFLLLDATRIDPPSTVYLDTYRTNRTYLALRVEALCRKIPRTETNTRLCHLLESLIYRKLDEMEQTVRLAQAGHLDRATAIFATNDGEQLKVEIVKTLDQLRLEESRGTLPSRLTSCLIPN